MVKHLDNIKIDRYLFFSTKKIVKEYEENMENLLT